MLCCHDCPTTGSMDTEAACLSLKHHSEIGEKSFAFKGDLSPNYMLGHFQTDHERSHGPTPSAQLQ
jgi:hypothetical protein